MVAKAFNPSTGEEGETTLECEVSLVYRVSGHAGLHNDTQDTQDFPITATHSNNQPTKQTYTNNSLLLHTARAESQLIFFF